VPLWNQFGVLYNKYMRDIKNFDPFSWAVGFWEGEGTVGVVRSESYRKRYLQLHATQADLEPLNKLYLGFQCGHITGPYNRGKKPVWHWTVSGEPAWELMNDMLPFLSDRRREQLYTKALEVLESRDRDVFRWMHYARVELSDGRVLEFDPDIHFEWSD